MPRPILSFIKSGLLRIAKRTTNPDFPPEGHTTLFRKGGLAYLAQDTGGIYPIEEIDIRDEFNALGGVQTTAATLITPLGGVVDPGVAGQGKLNLYPITVYRRQDLFQFNGGGGGTIDAPSGSATNVSTAGSASANGTEYLLYNLVSGNDFELRSPAGKNYRITWQPRLYVKMRFSFFYTRVNQPGRGWLCIIDGGTLFGETLTNDSFAINRSGFGFRIGKQGDLGYYKIRPFIVDNSTTPTIGAQEWDVITPDSFSSVELEAYYDYAASEVIFTVNGVSYTMTSGLITTPSDSQFRFASNVFISPVNEVFQVAKVIIEMD